MDFPGWFFTPVHRPACRVAGRHAFLAHAPSFIDPAEATFTKNSNLGARQGVIIQYDDLFSVFRVTLMVA